MIIGALVAVAAVIVGIVVFTGGDDDKGGTPSPGDSTADSSATTAGGGDNNNGGDPNDPCSSVRLSTELAADNLDAVTGTCDGACAVAARSGEPLFIAHVANGTWVRFVDLSTTGMRHDTDAVGFQWPATVIEAATWPCTTFAAPQAGAYVAESDGSEPLAVGMQGERVAGLQNAAADAARAAGPGGHRRHVRRRHPPGAARVPGLRWSPAHGAGGRPHCARWACWPTNPAPRPRCSSPTVGRSVILSIGGNGRRLTKISPPSSGRPIG